MDNLVRHIMLLLNQVHVYFHVVVDLICQCARSQHNIVFYYDHFSSVNLTNVESRLNHLMQFSRLHELIKLS